MKKYFIFISFLIFYANIYAQNKKFTIDDAAIGQWTKFYPNSLENLNFRPNTNSITYIKDEENIVEKELITNKEKIIAELKEYDYKWLDQDILKFQNKNTITIYDVVNKKDQLKITIPENSENIDFCKENYAVAYTLQNNLFVKYKNGLEKQITNDENSGIVNGNNFTHRREFGINKGIFFSPNGNYLAFYRKDETKVADYPLLDIKTRATTIKSIKYPMAGEKSEEVTLGVFNTNTQKLIYLQTEQNSEQYLTNISWSPDEKSIYILLLNREQNYLKINQYNAETGELVKTLFEEKNQKYVEPLNPLLFFKTKPTEFIYQSRKDGYNHLYIYNIKGNLVKQLTKGNWEVLEILGFDKKEENLFIIATKETPIEQHIYKVNIKTSKITKLSNEAGVHKAEISSDGTMIIDKFSNTQIPYVEKIINNKGKEIMILSKTPNKYTEYEMPDIKIFTIKAADNNTDLFCKIITPKNLDANKKYPVILYVYGGPHYQMIRNEWLGGASLWEYYMAQNGYIVFSVDNRGSANRGLEFENVIHRNLGQNEMLDQMKGIEYLKTLEYVDTNKIGVYGWSFGGFMSTSLILNYPETFKVAVAGGPVMDWKYYEVMYGERYMDSPQENTEGYKKISTLEKIENLNGKLLIIQGMQDDTVVEQNALNFLEQCIKNNKQVDYFTYPSHKHNVNGYDRIHLMQKVTNYFDDYLK